MRARNKNHVPNGNDVELLSKMRGQESQANTCSSYAFRLRLPLSTSCAMFLQIIDEQQRGPRQRRNETSSVAQASPTIVSNHACSALPVSLQSFAVELSSVLRVKNAQMRGGHKLVKQRNWRP